MGLQRFSERLMSREVRKWADITANPFWYRQIGPERTVFTQPPRPGSVLRLANAAVLATAGAELRTRRPAKPHAKHMMYLIFEELLATDQITLAPVGTGVDWDSERRPVDRIVLHHSKNPHSTRPGYHSAMELLRIYTLVYQGGAAQDSRLAERPLMHSGHADADGTQVFWIYHWMVGPDGQSTRYLQDDETGWQAGNWQANCRSAAVCIDADLSRRPPTELELRGVADVISANYGHVDIGPATLLGHGEVSPGNPCPGPDFIPGWKGRLLEMLGA